MQKLTLHDLKRQTIAIEKTPITLRALLSEDVTLGYVSWLNDFEIVKYTMQRDLLHTVDSVTKYVNKYFLSNVDILFGIFYENEHIGNIKLGPIIENKSAEIGFIIGEKSMWGKGITTKVVGKVLNISFDQIDLFKINSGAYKNNIGSIKALEKNKFILKEKKIYHDNNERLTTYLLYEKCNNKK